MSHREERCGLLPRLRFTWRPVDSRMATFLHAARDTDSSVWRSVIAAEVCQLALSRRRSLQSDDGDGHSESRPAPAASHPSLCLRACPLTDAHRPLPLEGRVGSGRVGSGICPTVNFRANSRSVNFRASDSVVRRSALASLIAGGS